MDKNELDEMAQSVVDGDGALARELATQVVSAGSNVLVAIEKGFAAGIRQVGELWEEGEFFLPELVQGAEAMKAALEVLRPALDTGRGGGTESLGRVVMGTVEGDLHDIGRSLVSTLLAANGFEVFDLGSDVSVEAFLTKAREVEPHIIGASALLTTTMVMQGKLAEAVAAADLPRVPHVLVGGAATSPVWAAEIGATHAENALKAVEAAKRLVA